MRRRAYLLTAGATLSGGCVGGGDSGPPETRRTPSQQPHLRVVNDSDGEQTFTVAIDGADGRVFENRFTLGPRAKRERETVLVTTPSGRSSRAASSRLSGGVRSTPGSTTTR